MGGNSELVERFIASLEARDYEGSADAVAFFEFADGLITRVTDFWPEPYEPPPGREHLVERW